VVSLGEEEEEEEEERERSEALVEAISTAVN
jgi:hypothetical protein